MRIAGLKAPLEAGNLNESNNGESMAVHRD